MLCGKLNKFEPITPGIFRVEAARAGKILIIDDLYASRPERFAQFVQMEHHEGRVRLFGGLKIPFHANVHLLRSTLEPAASAWA